MRPEAGIFQPHLGGAGREWLLSWAHALFTWLTPRASWFRQADIAASREPSTTLRQMLPLTQLVGGFQACP